MLDIIAFDADDTLWDNEPLYTATQEKLRHLLASYGYDGAIEQAVYQTEKANLPYFGYGIKSFTLSMIETAVRITGERITASDIQQIIQFAKVMIDTPPQLLPHVEETLAQLATRQRLMLITKGDLLDQLRKLENSGLDRYFSIVEVVSEKSSDTYQTILKKHGIAPQRFLMVGNSLRSDILPVLMLGAQAVYIPNATTWIHEHVDESTLTGYHEVEHIGLLPALLEQSGWIPVSVTDQPS